MSDERPDPGDVRCEQTGRVRVLKARCATCIFWPGARMHLSAERFEQVVRANVESEALLTCHDTLPYGRHPTFGPAVCNGFWSEHGQETLAGQLAARVLGVVRVDPPEETSR